MPTQAGWLRSNAGKQKEKEKEVREHNRGWLKFKSKILHIELTKKPSVGLAVMGTGFSRADPCSNPCNTHGRGMEHNHLELSLDLNVPQRVNRVQTKKNRAY